MSATARTAGKPGNPGAARAGRPSAGSEVHRAASALLKRLEAIPQVAVVLGSGLERAAPPDPEVAVPYAAIPGFPRSSVPGHAGRLLLARINRVPVAYLCGRAHFYEGHSLDRVVFPIRVLEAMGVGVLLLTNAAGGINPRFRPGDFMVFEDHLNFLGQNPLRGPAVGTHDRFTDLSCVYDPGLRGLLRRAARIERVRLHHGVYAAVSGPSYETPAEIRALARLGADAVGMSTVPEAIVARHCGMRVAALSCITNLAAGRSAQPLSHAEVLAAGARASAQAARVLGRFLTAACGALCAICP